MDFGQYINVNKFLIFSFILFFTVSINLSFEEINKSQIYEFFKKYISLLKNYYIWILGPAALSCFLSGYKIGGNISNTGLGLLLLYPIIFSIVNKIDYKWLKIFLIFAIFNVSFFSIKSVQNLKSFYDIKNIFENQKFKKNETVLYGSTFYTIVKNEKLLILNDYWTDAQRNGDQLYISLLNNLKKDNVEYVLIESYLKDKFDKHNKKFEVLIENNIGLFAKKINF